MGALPPLKPHKKKGGTLPLHGAHTAFFLLSSPPAVSVENSVIVFSPPQSKPFKFFLKKRKLLAIWFLLTSGYIVLYHQKGNSVAFWAPKCQKIIVVLGAFIQSKSQYLRWLFYSSSLFGTPKTNTIFY